MWHLCLVPKVGWPGRHPAEVLLQVEALALVAQKAQAVQLLPEV